jgi:predicted dehydrogenase
MKTYRVGIIGCGRKASTIDDEVSYRWLTNYDVAPSSHASAYRALSTTKLVAAASRTRESVDRFGKRWNLQREHRYTNYLQMLEKERLDIVSVTTHADKRAEVVIAAAEAGVKGILAEKAMATSAAEADMMLKACENRNVKLLINHPRRYHPVFRQAKKTLESGTIGQLSSMRGAIWTFLIHNGTHLWDMFRYFAGRADWVSGTLRSFSRGDSAGYGMVHFSNDVFAFADVATMQGMNLQLYGTKGMIQVDMFTPGFTCVTYEDVVPSSPERPSYQFGPRRIGEVRQIPPPKSFNPMQNAVSDLIGSIEQNRQPQSSGEDGRAALEIALAFHISDMNQGSRVPLPLAQRSFRVVSR